MRELNLSDRAHEYQKQFPNYPVLWVDKNWLMGVWLIGQLWKRTDASIYGGYPGNFLKRLLSLFPTHDHRRTLHLFAGNTPASVGGIRVDLSAERRPNVIADARALPFQAVFDLVIADPPYSSADAERYGHRMISRRHVMAEIRKVIRPGGFLCWLDTVRPMYRRQDWQQVGAIAVLVSTNTRTRLLSIFQTAEACNARDDPRDLKKQLGLWSDCDDASVCKGDSRDGMGAIG